MIGNFAWEWVKGVGEGGESRGKWTSCVIIIAHSFVSGASFNPLMQIR